MIKLPDAVTPEQFRQAAPLIIRSLLSQDGGYTDSIDELNWEVDGDEISGTFTDKRPEGDRVFEYSLVIGANSVDRVYRPISGVKFDEGDDDNPEFEAAYPDQDALDAAIDALDDADFQEQITGILQPILDLVAQSSDYSEVQEKLAALYPQMDSGELEQKLARAIFVSEVWGRVNAGS